jgi:hypothetical protein
LSSGHLRDMIEEFCKNNYFETFPNSPFKPSIDRIDTNGDYSPDNCRWATLIDQASNTRKVKKCRINGVEYPTLHAAARELNIEWKTFYTRIARKLPGYEIVS